VPGPCPCRRPSQSARHGHPRHRGKHAHRGGHHDLPSKRSVHRSSLNGNRSFTRAAGRQHAPPAICQDHRPDLQRSTHRRRGSGNPAHQLRNGKRALRGAEAGAGAGRARARTSGRTRQPCRGARGAQPSGVRRLKMFIRGFVCDPNDARRSRVKGAVERPLTRRRPNPKKLVKVPFTDGQRVARGDVPDCRDLTATMTATGRTILAQCWQERVPDRMGGRAHG